MAVLTPPGGHRLWDQGENGPWVSQETPLPFLGDPGRRLEVALVRLSWIGLRSAGPNADPSIKPYECES